MSSNVPPGLDVRACIRFVIPTPFENDMVRQDFLYLAQYGFNLKMLITSAFYHLSNPQHGNVAFSEEISDISEEMNDIILDSTDSEVGPDEYIALTIARHFYINHGEILDTLWRCYTFLINKFKMLGRSPIAEGLIMGVEETPYTHQLVVYVQREHSNVYGT